MEEKTNSEKSKMTYEQLENVAHQLSEQSRQLSKKLNEANLFNMFKRIEFLLSIVNSKNINLFSEDFIKSVVSEIEELMQKPKQEEE